MRKTKTIPFDLAMAKEIHEGKREGEIVTREGNPVEIVRFGANLKEADIIFITYDTIGDRRAYLADQNGKNVNLAIGSPYDLLLRVPDVTPSFRPFDKVLVRLLDSAQWSCDLFSHMDFNEVYPYVCITGHYKYCIPYEGNEELVGTSNKPKNE